MLPRSFLCALAVVIVATSSFAADDVSSAAPGRATYTPGGLLNDDFSSGDLTERYFVQSVVATLSATGLHFETSSPDAQVYQSGGELVLDTGTVLPAANEWRATTTLGLTRAINAAQDFQAQVRMAVHPSSTGQFRGMFVVFDGTGRTDDVFGFGIDHRVDMSGTPQWRVTNGETMTVLEEFQTFQFGQYVTVSLSFDAASRVLTIDVPDEPFRYSRTVVLPNYDSFTIGFQGSVSYLDGFDFPMAGRGIFVFDDLQSNLETGSYRVDPRPLTFNNRTYDETPTGDDSPFPELTDLTPGAIWLVGSAPYRVWFDNTALPLDGVQNINAALVRWGGKYTTVYSTYSRQDFEAMAPSGIVLDAFAPSILKARGFGEDYEWHLAPPIPPTPPSCGLNCGAGGCNVPAAGVGSATNVNLVNGNLFHRAQVIAGVPGDAGPQLNYNAHNGRSVLGRGWSHAAMTSIRVTPDYHLRLLTPSGGEITFRPLEFTPEGALDFTPADGCCVGNYLRARGSPWAGIEIVERGGTAWHYAITGGGAIAKTTPAGLVYTYTYLPDGRLSETSDPYGRVYRFGYNDDGYLGAITDPAGAVTSFHYVGDKLVRVVDPRGAEERYEYNGANLMSKLIDKAGFTWRFGYDLAGRAVAVTDATGHTKRVTYLQNANAAVINDRRNQPTVYEFDPSLNVITKLTDPLSRTTTQEFDADGNMVRRIDPAGYRTVTEYDVYHQPTRIVDAAGGVRTTDYNEWGLPTREVDPMGNVTTMVYDSQANRILTTDALGYQSTAAYDAQGNKIAETNRAGEMTTYAYQDGVVVRETNGAGDSTWFEVDALGRTTAVIDGAGNRTQIGLDGLGLEAYKIYPDGFSVATYRDGLGRELGTSAAAEPRQVIATKSFDANGNVTSTTTFLGLTAHQGYDPEGNQTAELSPAGRSRGFTYDDAGQNVLTLDGDGVQQVATYDTRGNYAETLDANQAVTRFEYDGLNRLVRLEIDDSVFTYSHDLNGNLLEESANGRVTRHAYDELNRRVSTTDPLGNVTTFVHDPEGRVIRQTDPLGRTTYFGFDMAGRKIAQHNPDGGILRWEYDERGLKSAEIDALGHRTEHVYDSRSRLIDTIDPLGGHWRKEYDDAGRLVAEENPLGERTSYVLDADGRTIKKIDPLGRVTDFVLDADGNQIGVLEPGLTPADRVYRSKTFNAKSEVVKELADAADASTETRFERDVAGKIIAYIDERGFARSYDYNLKGELTSITDALGNVISFTRNADGDVVAKSYTGAGQVHYSFDQGRRLVGKTLIAPQAGEQSSFSYDAAGQLVRRDSTLTGAGPLSQAVSYVYGYDFAGREAVYEEVGGVPVHYSWDVEGNRTSVSVPGTMYLVTTEYDANHRPTRMVDAWTGDIWYFNHDAANRRTSVVYPDGSAIFTSYDAAGQVVEQRAIAATGAILFLEQNTFDQRGNITQTLTQDERRSYSYNRRDWLTLTVVEDLVAGTFYFQKLDYNASGSLIRQELRAPNQNKLPFTEIFYNSQEGTPELTENIVVSYQYSPADQLVYERGTRDDGSFYEANYTWDGAGNMAGKKVRDFKGNQVVNTMTWSAENRLLAQTNDNGLVFYNPSLVEKDGKEQNTWATDRTWLNNKYVSRAYDHHMRHVIWEGDAANPEARYILGPNRDELLASAVKMGGGVVRSYTYQNFRQDVLSVQSANALYSSTRKYLPTGLAITDGQSPGNPGRGRNPPNPNPYSPPPPLPFGWKGKERLGNAGLDFNNRVISPSLRFLSVDPLVSFASLSDVVLAKQKYVGFDSNTVLNTDIEGLYTVSSHTCTTTYRSTLHNAMNPYVKNAVNSSCLSGLSLGLKSCMSGRYGSTLYIGCASASRSFCGWTPTWGNSYIWINVYKAARTGCGTNDYQDTRLILGDYQSKAFQDNLIYAYKNVATTLLHEMTHTCGRLEPASQSCEWACRKYTGSYYPASNWWSRTTAFCK